MQENHSFDNYFGVLPYAPAARTTVALARTATTLASTVSHAPSIRLGNLNCTNSNIDDDGSPSLRSTTSNYCPGPDLQHDWQGAIRRPTFPIRPTRCLRRSTTASCSSTTRPSSLDDDRVADRRRHDGLLQPGRSAVLLQLAQTFAIDDRYFCSVVGPTFPNRSYEMAATSFGHVTTNEIFPPGINPANPSPLNTSIGYQPATGSIFDLLDEAKVTWFNYFAGSADLGDLPRQPRPVPGRACPLGVWRRVPSAATEFRRCRGGRHAAAVSFVDPSFAPDETLTAVIYETDEHPPFDIRAGEYIISQSSTRYETARTGKTRSSS